MTGDAAWRRSPRLRCSEPRHTFRFVGRHEDVTGPDSGPMADWLVWRSDEHEPTVEGVVRHAIAIDPDRFWHKLSGEAAP